MEITVTHVKMCDYYTYYSMERVLLPFARLQSTSGGHYVHRSVHYDMIDGKPTTMVIGMLLQFSRVEG